MNKYYFSVSSKTAKPFDALVICDSEQTAWNVINLINPNTWPLLMVPPVDDTNLKIKQKIKQVIR